MLQDCKMIQNEQRTAKNFALFLERKSKIARLQNDAKRSKPVQNDAKSCKIKSCQRLVNFWRENSKYR